MNKPLCFLAAMLVVAFGLPTAFAEAPKPIEIQCPAGFSVTHIGQPNAGHFLLTGIADDPSGTGGIMLCVGTDGQVLWLQKVEGSRRYGGAEYLDKGTIVALRSKGETEKWTAQFIRQGKVIHETKTLTGVAGIHCASGSLFTYGTSKPHSARIEKFNAEGESMWKIDWKELCAFRALSRSAICMSPTERIIYGIGQSDPIASYWPLTIKARSCGGMTAKHTKDIVMPHGLMIILFWLVTPFLRAKWRTRTRVLIVLRMVL
jgi:hypothetical protein